MSASIASTPRPVSRSEDEILRAVRELSYGVVEVVVHDRRITEIRQTRRTRVADVD